MAPRPRIRAAAAAVAALLVPLAVPAASPAAAADLTLRGVPQESTFEALVPARVLDTRPGGSTIDGTAAGAGAVGPAATIHVPITGRGGVPATGVGAVVLNVTANQPTATSYVTVWPAGGTRPNASNLNVVAGQTVPNLVVAQVGTGGRISIFNETGSVHLLADVVGWFADTSGFTGVLPARLLDTRVGGTTIDGVAAAGGAVGAAAERTVRVIGRGGVPASGVGAVVLNVTAVLPTAAGFATVWPTGRTRPNASNLNFTARRIVPNLVVAQVGDDGQVSIFNEAGATHFLADVVGWFAAGSELTSVLPARLMDTRPGATTIDGRSAGQGPIIANGGRELTVTGRGGVPATGVGAVIVNVTAANATAEGYLTIYPTPSSAAPLFADRPNASNLNVRPGLTVPNLVVAAVGAGGQITIYSAVGSADVLVDVVGWLPPFEPAGIDPGALAPAVVGQAFSGQFTPTGSKPAYSLARADGAPGLSMTGGVVTGIPTTAGTFATSVSITDRFSRTTVTRMSHAVFEASAGYQPLATAVRTLDTRLDPAPLTASRTIAFNGNFGLPSSGIAAVVLRVRSVSGGTSTVQIQPDLGGGPVPLTLFHAAGPTPRTNTVVVQLGPSGGVALSSAFGGPVDVTVDVVGWFPADSSYTATSPTRVVDTRTGASVAPGAGATVSLTTAPPTATAAIVRIVTLDGAGGAGAITLWPTGGSVPAVPTMRFADASVEDQRAVVPLGPGRSFDYRNTGPAATHVFLEVEGYLVPELVATSLPG